MLPILTIPFNTKILIVTVGSISSICKEATHVYKFSNLSKRANVEERRSKMSTNAAAERFRGSLIRKAIRIK